MVALVGFVVAFWGTWEAVRVDESTAPIAITPPESVSPSDIVTLFKHDSIRAIDNPNFESVEQGDKNFEPDERVVEIINTSEARAYPIVILSSHEIVNAVVGLEPIAITCYPLFY